MEMNRKHQATLEAVFTDPVLSGVAWRDIEALLAAASRRSVKGKGHGSGSS